MRIPTNRPRVICHMAASLDGRIVVEGWHDSVSSAVRREYEAVHASYEADAWLCGRVTMEPFAKRTRANEEIEKQQRSSSRRSDFRAPGNFTSFAVALDPRGRLAWESNDIAGDHVIAVVTKQVSDEYLDFLHSRGVSYIIAGENEVDLAAALDRLASNFGVRTLMLEGGGRINGAMLRAGLIDEISVLIAPVVDGTIGVPTLFDADTRDDQSVQLRLETVERRDDGVLWVRYQVD
jgi:2,5-diamino-6-(ribosylamino)-4(3H)-pyrimidinone 5'-phosphate reductase